jgi:shikimate dehydrogenase
MQAKHKSACVIGWPIEHSRSPLIHNYWIKQYGLDAQYRREAVPPERLAEFLAHLADHGYLGANVTVPHKEAALALSEPDALARAVGAANTLWLEGGVLRSTNTDVEGFVANLDAAAPGWDRGVDAAVVLGAGGAAQAVVFGLIGRNMRRVRVVNRNFDRALALRDRFGQEVEPVRLEDTAAAVAGARLLVNATTLGMSGQPPLAVDLAPLAPDAVVVDIVYVPLVTPLLAAARARGMRTADGLGMLLFQAVAGFARWFGVRPRVEPDLRALVEADLMRA